SELSTKEGVRMAILTDDDFSGWAMAREVPGITRIGIRIDTLERLGIPIDEVAEDLPKPKGSEKKVNVDYRANNHATAAERIYNERLIPEEDWELLTSGKYGRRIEIDNVIAYVGAERFWNRFILPCFQELFDAADYNLSLKKVAYVSLPNLNLLNKLAEKAGTIAVADEVNEIESEYIEYDISTKGFIKDIEAVKEANTKRIENKELKDEHIQWLEEHLALLSEEFSRRTGLPLPSED
ncbi:MAG: hypothetical protein ACRD8W_21760, partial [Nitrososphaeraceae archaeon]